MPLSVVASVPAGEVRASVRTALELAQRGFLEGVRGLGVLVKANLNSPHPFPATTSLDFLGAVVSLLFEAGAARVMVGDSCGLRWAPAADVHSRLGIPGFCTRSGAEWVNFDEGPWVTRSVNGELVREVSLPAALGEADLLVYAACLKTHRAARFSISLKHAVGFLPPEERRAVHDARIEQRIAEINLALKPDMILVDARRCFTAGGPARGWVRRPLRILASTDRVAMDAAGIRLLASFPRFNRVLADPWANPQIRHAAGLGIGARREEGFRLVEG